MIDVDVAVIGAGIAGLSAGWALAVDCSVAVLEQEPTPGVHATGRSAAVLSETSGPAAVCALAKASRSFLTNPPDSFSETALLRPSGLLWVSDRVDGVDDLAIAAADLAVPHQRLSGAEACEVVDVLRQDWVASALLEPAAKKIDVAALLAGYRAGLIARGGRLLTSQRVVSLERSGLGWTVHSGDEPVSCEVVVNAGGAWADEIAQRAGVPPVGLRPLLRTAFTFPTPADTSQWPLVMDCSSHFYFEPEGTGLLASPADETPAVPHDARADELAIARAVDALAAATSLRVRGVRAKWAGLRTFAPDRVPVVGFDTTEPGFFWLAGQGGGGIKTAPALARLASDQIAGRADGDDLGLGPQRFGR